MMTGGLIVGHSALDKRVGLTGCGFTPRTVHTMQLQQELSAS